MEISNESIEKATAHLIIACLRNQKEFVLYKDPLAEIQKECENIKSKLRNYYNNPFVEFCGDEKVHEKILERMATNDWGDKKSLTKTQRTKYIKSIASSSLAKKLGISAKDISKELTEHADNDFLMRLKQSSVEKRVDILESWLSKDIEDFGKQIYQKRESKSSSPKGKTSAKGKTVTSDYGSDIEDMTVAEELVKFYKEENIAPKAWIEEKKKKTKYPTAEWIETKLIDIIRDPIMEKINRNLKKKKKLTDDEILQFWLEMEIVKREEDIKKMLPINKEELISRLYKNDKIHVYRQDGEIFGGKIYWNRPSKIELNLQELQEDIEIGSYSKGVFFRYPGGIRENEHAWRYVE
jgi:hypothetical protein